jgi:hypothetical protein
VFVKSPEHSLVLLVVRAQRIAKAGSVRRFLKFLNSSENGRVPFGDLPILAAMGHSPNSIIRAFDKL